MMKLQIISKKMFLASIGLLVYFSLLFTGLTAKIDWAVFGAIYEFVTIPLILLVAAIFLFASFQFLIKRKTNFYLVSSCIISLMIIILMFIIN